MGGEDECMGQITELAEERKRLYNRLQLINVNSTGRDMLIKRIEVIDEQIRKMTS